MEVEFEDIFRNLDINKDWDHITIQKCIKNIIKKEGFLKYTVHKKEYTPDGGNYLGVLGEIDIKGKTATEEKEVNLFLKIIISGDKLTHLSLRNLYKKELFLYCELSKIFADLQDEVDLPHEERYVTVKGYEESNTNVIILENMAKKGYKTYSRMNCITLNYAEMSVQKLAKFHGLSFVLKDRRPKYFESRIKPMEQPFTFNDNLIGFIRNNCKMAANCLDKNSLKKFEHFVSRFVEVYYKRLTTKCGKDVLCHGDYRANNILMKEVDGEITDVMPIDYQFLFYGCPLLDFIYFIFLSTDQKFREAYLTHLKELYYESLRMFLKYFDLDSANVYPKDEFNKHYEEFLDYGLICSVIILPLVMANENDIPDITNTIINDVDISVDNRYRGRIMEIVEDFIKSGHL